MVREDRHRRHPPRRAGAAPSPTGARRSRAGGATERSGRTARCPATRRRRSPRNCGLGSGRPSCRRSATSPKAVRSAGVTLGWRSSSRSVIDRRSDASGSGHALAGTRRRRHRPGRLGPRAARGRATCASCRLAPRLRGARIHGRAGDVPALLADQRRLQQRRRARGEDGVGVTRVPSASGSLAGTRVGSALLHGARARQHDGPERRSGPAPSWPRRCRAHGGGGTARRGSRCAVNATAPSSIAAMAIAGSSHTQSTAAENANADRPASAAAERQPRSCGVAPLEHEDGLRSAARSASASSRPTNARLRADSR